MLSLSFILRVVQAALICVELLQARLLGYMLSQGLLPMLTEEPLYTVVKSHFVRFNKVLNSPIGSLTKC